MPEAWCSYGGEVNYGLLGLIGPIAGTVLDIGSGTGAWAPLLREAGAERLIAIEPAAVPQYAAHDVYDEVITDPVETASLAVAAEADLIILADCLEHLVDPWAVLRSLRTKAKDTARLALSVPNLRYYRLNLALIFAGRFEYSDAGGLMDRTHLRWFTRGSLEQSLRDTGWEPVGWSGALGRKRELLSKASAHRLDAVLWHQLYVVARPIADWTPTT